MSDFVPPLFKNLGKAVADLFKEQFDFKHQLKVKTNSSSGLTLESALETGKESKLDGNVKATYKQADLGTLQAEVHTTGTTKYNVKFDKLHKGLAVKVSGDEKPAGKLEVDYAQAHVAVSLNADVSKSATSVDAALVAGTDGLSVGGAAKYDISGQQLADLNAAAEYAQSDFSVTVKTSDFASKITTSYLHKTTADTQVAASLLYDIDGNKRVLTVGSQHKCDSNNNTKVKLDTNGILAFVWEHKLTGQNAKLQLASEFSAKSVTTVPTKLGLGIHLGDV